MSRLLTPVQDRASLDARPVPAPDGPAPAPPVTDAPSRDQELEQLRREVQSLRLQHRRDLATARGLGEALQAIRRGAMALRTENEELRREIAGRGSRRR